ncbi:hypothetical protein HOY80DRAFT_894649 [Tuber brumale]|nr:hypothetical protein HOY80DRAFT_894649 [Tuber brumale]
MPPTAPSTTRGPARSPTPNSSGPAAGPPNGAVRRNTLRDRELSSGNPSRNSTSSPLSARSAAKRPSSNSSDADFEGAAILEDLRSRLAQSESAAEAAAEEYAKQVKALQIRLEEALGEQMRMEEVCHAKDEVIENFEIQIKDLTRAKRDQDNIYEAERIAAQQEKEEMLDREEELNAIVQRLKDSLAQREKSADCDSRNSLESPPADEPLGFAPSNNAPTPNRGNNILLQKDKLIESLRLELAEAQIRLAEADHQGGAKLHQLEQQLLETRVTNARLMEDNESFQLLLSSAALNGDFPRGDYNDAFSEAEPEPESHVVKKVQGSPRNSISLGSNLAEELEEAAHSETEKYRKAESELKLLKEQNKAMSLYINNIIERILQHKDSEAILDKTASLSSSEAAPTSTDKALPPPPAEEEPGHGKILQRTKSLANRNNAKPPKQPTEGGAVLTRSQSMRAPPIGAHKRSQSDANTVYSGASVVNNLYRGEGIITPRSQTFYGNEQFNKGNRPRNSDISLDSTTSDLGDLPARPAPSPTHSAAVGPIAGNKLRPLRLVQENVRNGIVSPPLQGGSRKISGDYKDGIEDPNAKLEKRQSKRSSWMMSLFNRNKEDQASVLPAENVLFERKDVE